MRWFYFIFYFYSSLVLALKVESFVDKQTVALNESFIFTIQIQTQEDNKWNVPNVSFNDFSILNRWSGEQTSIQIFNGKMQKTNVFSKNYTLQAKTTGNLRIEPVTVKTHNKSFTTNPIFITVTKANSNKPPVKTPHPGPSTIPFLSSPPQVFDYFKKSLTDLKNDTKIILSLNKKNIYRAEMIKADWFILQSSGSFHYNQVQPPLLKGFWKEEIKNKNSRRRVKPVLIDKILYEKTLLTSFWLFPLQTGVLTVDPYSIRTNSFLSFGSSDKLISSPAKQIRVKNLPPRPVGDWTGGVGTYKVHAELKDKTAFTYQPLSYKIIFKGVGHPRFISLPDMVFAQDVQTYPPVEKSHFSDTGVGTKEFEILITPKKEGVLNIPALKLITFDPQKEQYIYHNIPAYSLPVKKGKVDKESKQVYFEEDKKPKEEIVLPPSLSSFPWPSWINFYFLRLMWLILMIPFALGVLIVYVKHFILKKEKTLNKVINKKFLKIQNLLYQKDWQKACMQMIQLNNFILDKAQITDSFSSWREAVDNLPPVLKKKHSKSFTQLFKELEDLSFSPSSQSQKRALNKAGELFKTTKKLVKSLLADL